MIVRISRPRRADLKAAFDFLYEDNPRAAAATLDELLRAIQTLGDLSDRGRPGRIHGTREFVVTRTGQVIAYVVRANEVVVVRVRHGRQFWPN